MVAMAMMTMMIHGQSLQARQNLMIVATMVAISVKQQAHLPKHMVAVTQSQPLLRHGVATVDMVMMKMSSSVSHPHILVSPYTLGTEHSTADTTQQP
jgi:hypothetical protein